MLQRRSSNGTIAAPNAETPHAAAVTGPMIAAACSRSVSSSDSRIGMNDSNATMPKPQNSSTATSARSTRDRHNRRTPSSTTPGVARIECATPATRVDRSSCMIARATTIWSIARPAAIQKGRASEFSRPNGARG